jgi:hypothetical protein
MTVEWNKLKHKLHIFKNLLVHTIFERLKIKPNSVRIRF